MTDLRRMLVVLTDPDGLTMDVSARLDVGAIGSFSETTEETLLDVVVGDIDLTLRDDDGAVEAFLEDAEPGDVYEVTIDRETGKRRPKYERVFAGVLDTPYSISIDRKAKTVSLQAFTYTKMLEDGDAENVQRSVTGLTGSVTAAADTVTLTAGDTDDLAVGDDITLNNGTDEETQRIESITDSTHLVTVANWDNTFSSAALTLETPYYRSKSITWLIEQLLAETEIDEWETSLTQEISETPLLQDMNTTDLPGTAPRSMVEEDENISLTYGSGARQIATGPADEFTDGAASTAGQGDWRPYLATEPSSIQSAAGGSDDGTYAWDHTNGHRYTLNVDVQTDTPTPGLDTTTLQLNQDGAYFADLDSYVSGANSGYDDRSLDYDAENNYLWWSLTEDGAGRSATGYYDISGTSNHSVDALFGELRCVVGKSAMARLRGTTLEFMDLATRAVLQSLTVSSGLQVWTLRTFEDVLAGIYAAGGQLRVKLWDQTLLTEVADYKIRNGTASADVYLTVFSMTGEDVAIGYANGTYFVLAKSLIGIVPYADFEGMSVAAALRDIALISGCYISVDEYKALHFRSRLALTDYRNREAVAMPDPLEHTSAPYGEHYIRSCRVTGEDADGEEIVRIAGDSGNSANRLELDPQLVTTEAMADAIGAQYVALLGSKRALEEITIPEQDEIIRAMRLVTLSGVTYLALEIDSDYEIREQSLTLLEVA